MIKKNVWEFETQVNNGWFDSFVNSFPGGDVEFIPYHWDDAPTTYFWSSPHLDNLTDPAQIGKRAASLKAIYDGSMYVYRLGNYSRWTLRPCRNSIGMRSEHVELQFPSEPFSPDWEKWTFRDVDDPHRSDVSTYLFLSHFNDTVKNMLLFLGVNGPSWVTLYALKDFMQKADGWTEERLATVPGQSKSKLEVFRQTANNFAAIGPFARHGEVGWTPPRSPMTHDEAKTVILTCAHAFMIEQARILDTPGEFKKRCV